MSWKKETVEKGPHPDAKKNYEDWSYIFIGKPFQAKLRSLKANIKEFFRWQDNEVFYHRFKPAFKDEPEENDIGIEDPNNALNRITPPFLATGIPMCVQISFLDRKGRRNCANINFQLSNPDFRDECTYFLKVDWNKDDPDVWK